MATNPESLKITAEAMTDELRLRYAVIYGTSHPEMYMTPEQAEIDRLRAENEKLRAALKPFALSEHKIERWFGMDIPDSYSVVSQWVTVGDLRAASDTLKDTQ